MTDTLSSQLGTLRQAIQDSAEALTQTDGDAINLAARTRRLARPFERDSRLLAASRQALTFQLGRGEHAARYAWPVAQVRGLTRVSRLTPIPGAPPLYRGVVNWRGSVLLALDLNVYFGQTSAESLPPWLIVLGDSRLEVGVLVDEVFDVMTIRDADLAALPESSTGLVIGITAGKLSVLNAERLLAQEWDRVQNRRQEYLT